MIALKGTIQDVYNLLIAPQTDYNNDDEIIIALKGTIQDVNNLLIAPRTDYNNDNDRTERHNSRC